MFAFKQNGGKIQTMNNSLFYLPFFYLFRSRLGARFEQISWIILYPGFLLFTGYINHVDWVSILVLIAALINVYEIGYMWNDYGTVVTEKNPSLRFEEGKSYILGHFKRIVFARYAITFLSLDALYRLNKIGWNDFVELIAFMVLLQIVFIVHNKIRSHMNIITYFGLVGLRYTIPLMPWFEIKQIVVVLLLFPVVRSLEYASKERFELNFLKWIGNHLDLSRVLFYTLIVIAFIIFGSNAELLWGALYFLGYRVIAYMIVKLGIVSR
jgi:hypothetical protein